MKMKSYKGTFHEVKKDGSSFQKAHEKDNVVLGLGPAKPTVEGYFGKFESSLTRRRVNKYSLSNINKLLQIFNKS